MEIHRNFIKDKSNKMVLYKVLGDISLDKNHFIKVNSKITTFKVNAQ